MAKPVPDHSPSASRRQFLTVSLLLPAAISAGCVANPDKPRMRILFVCQAGTAKSAIAREIFKKKAALAGIDAEVFSRGIVIEDHVSPELRQRLAADGIDTLSEPFRTLQPADAKAADVVVEFNPLPASIQPVDLRDWTDTPSVNDDYDNAKRVMDARIDGLITEIAAKGRKEATVR